MKVEYFIVNSSGNVMLKIKDDFDGSTLLYDLAKVLNQRTDKAYKRILQRDVSGFYINPGTVEIYVK